MAQFYVSKQGDDNNDGLSDGTAKKTVPAALAIPTTDQITNIQLKFDPAPYTEPVNVTYYRGVNIIGYGGGKPTLRAAGAGVLLLAQDHALFGLTGVRINSSVVGAILIQQRQFVIGDYVNCDWGGQAIQSCCIFATDYNTVNFAGDQNINGGSGSFVSINNSTLYGSCSFIMNAPGATFTDGFIVGSSNALLKFQSALFMGPGGNVNTIGKQWVLSSGSQLWKPSAYPYPIPGSIQGTKDATSTVY